MKSKALRFLINIRKNISNHYKSDSSFLEILYEDEPNVLEDYFYLSYKDYDRLRLIIVNILHLMIHDFKYKKTKHKKKVQNLMILFNNTRIYFSYPINLYLYEIQKYFNNILFIYYKDYVYKACLSFTVVCGGENNEEEYYPIELKILPVLYKTFGKH